VNTRQAGGGGPPASESTMHAFTETTIPRTAFPRNH
jgi:hypothetical protein